MVGEELRRLFTWQERHRRLLARLIIAFGLTLVVDLVGALLVWNWESGLKKAATSTASATQSSLPPCKF